MPNLILILQSRKVILEKKLIFFNLKIISVRAQNIALSFLEMLLWNKHRKNFPFLL